MSYIKENEDKETMEIVNKYRKIGCRDCEDKVATKFFSFGDPFNLGLPEYFLCPTCCENEDRKLFGDNLYGLDLERKSYY